MSASDAPLSIGKVSLTVNDLDAVSRFYEQAIGLQPVSSEAGLRRLGTGDTVLIELRQDRDARQRSRREAGLFHTAFLLPSRADLGRWVKHAAETRLPIQGASDHIVSEALYLSDPEGNGIEVYADRPRDRWTAADGTVIMATEALDVENLAAAAGATNWQGYPAGGIVGHVHLQVGAVEPADAFYGGVLGFDLTARYPGASFFSTGGYHHHLAANVWNSRGAGERSFPSTGLADVTMIAADAETLAATRARAQSAAVASEDRPNGFSLRDPWGTSLSITAAKG